MCAEQSLDGYLGRRWTLGEAAYLAFKGPKRVVRAVLVAAERAKVLAEAQQRLVDTVDAIERRSVSADARRCVSLRDVQLRRGVPKGLRR